MPRALGSWPHYNKERIPSTKNKPLCGPDPTHPTHPSVQGTTVQGQEPEISSMPTGAFCAYVTAQHLTCLCSAASACCGHTLILAFGDPAQYLGHGNNEATQLQCSNNSAGASFHASRRKTTTRCGDWRCTAAPVAMMKSRTRRCPSFAYSLRTVDDLGRVSGDDTATVTAPDGRERFHKK